MASPSTVITLGFGSFGSVNLVPTLGYGAGIVTAPTTPGEEWTLPDNRMHWTHDANRAHWKLPTNRLHWTIPGEDDA